MCLLALALVGQAFAAPAAHGALQQRIASVLQKPKVLFFHLLELQKAFVNSLCLGFWHHSDMLLP